MAINYAVLKNTQLTDLCSERDILLDRPIRGEMIKALMKWDMEQGEAEEMLEIDEEGEIVNSETKPEEETVKVTFHSKDEQDAPYVFVGLNGKGFYLPKETEIVIPKVLLNVIDDAIEYRFEQFKDNQGRTKFRPKKIHRFPYTILHD